MFPKRRSCCYTRHFRAREVRGSFRAMRRLRTWSGSPRSRARESTAKSTFTRKNTYDLEDFFPEALRRVPVVYVYGGGAGCLTRLVISPSADGPADGPGAAIYRTSSSGPSKTCMKSSLFEISCNSITLQRRPPSKTFVIQWFFEEILQFP